MNFKNIFLVVIITVLALFLISNVNAVDNNTADNDIELYEDAVSTDLEFEQTSDSQVVNKGDIFETHLSVKNVGSKTYNNLTINYPLPAGLELIISPVEYQNDLWVIDTLYPNETNYLTLVCVALVSNTTYEFTASLGNESVTTMDVYCPGENIIPDDDGGNNTDSSSSGLIKSVTEGKNLKDTANPILLLLFTIIFIPYIRLKY